MALVPLDIPPGINSDDTTFSAAGRWADGSGVRFRQGKPETISGDTSFASTGASSACQGIGGLTASSLIFAAYTNKLYKIETSGTVTDITPVGLSGVGGPWSFGTFGSVMLAAPKDSKLYVTSGSTATHVSTAPAAITAMLVTPQRQVLAFGCNEEVSGTFNGRCIRGSNLEDYTNWTTLSTNNVFEHIIDDPGRIVGAELIGSYVAIWTETSLFIGTFIGDPSQTYRFDRVDTDCGLEEKRAVTVHDGVAYWLGRDLNFYAWAPGGQVRALPCPIGKEMRDNWSGGNTHLIAIPRYNEIWLYYNDSRDVGSGLSRYVIYNISENCWSRGSAFTAGTAVFSSQSLAGFLSSYENGAYLLGSGGSIVVAGDGTPDAASYIQSADQYINNSQRRMMVRSFIPDFEQLTGAAAVTLYVRAYPQSSATTKGPYAIASSSTTKKDFRASGKIMSFKISADTAVRWRLGKSLFDMVPLGER